MLFAALDGHLARAHVRQARARRAHDPAGPTEVAPAANDSAWAPRRPGGRRGPARFPGQRPRRIAVPAARARNGGPRGGHRRAAAARPAGRTQPDDCVARRRTPATAGVGLGRGRNPRSKGRPLCATADSHRRNGEERLQRVLRVRSVDRRPGRDGHRRGRPDDRSDRHAGRTDRLPVAAGAARAESHSSSNRSSVGRRRSSPSSIAPVVSTTCAARSRGSANWPRRWPKTGPTSPRSSAAAFARSAPRPESRQMDRARAGGRRRFADTPR